MKTNLLRIRKKIINAFAALIILCISMPYANAQYCSATAPAQNCNGSTYAYPFFIGAVRLNTMNFKNTQGCSTGGPVSYYEFVSGSTTTLTQGSTYTIEIDNNMGWTSISNWPITANAWIDLNDDKKFDPSEAMIANSPMIYTSTPNSPSTTSYTFTIPCSSKVGKIRLRVRSHYSSTMPSTGACGSTSTSWGAIKDFDITIAAGNTTPVANFILPSTTIFENSPTFFTNSNQQGYTHEWFVDENNNGNFVSVSKSTNLNYAFLSAGTKQVKLVSTNCVGSANVVKTVTAISPNNAPTPLFVANLTNIEVKPGTLYGGDADIFLYDLSTDGPSSWNWSFTSQEPGEIAYFIEDYYQNPLFITLDTGTYSICLDATNKIGTNSLCKTDYITINYPASSANGDKFENWICRETSCSLDSGVLYDTEGPNIDNSMNKFCGFTIGGCEVKEIKLSFSDFNLSYNQTLNIYDGKNASATLLGSYRQTSTKPDDMIAKSGNVYVEFITGGNCCYNTSGFKITWKSTVNKDGGPKANFEIPKSLGGDTVFSCATGNSVQFNGTSTGSLLFTKTHWIFDYSPNVAYPVGFNNSANPNPTYTYTTLNKRYNVRLVVESCEGMDTIIKSFYLATTSLRPKVDFVASENIIFPGESTKITNKSKAGCSGKWTISPATGWAYTSGNATSNEIVVKFADKGRYTVTREETNDNGTSSITKSEFIEVISYCNPSSAILTTEAGISQVKFGKINNPSSSGVMAYEDFSVLGTFEAVMGETYNLEVSRKGITDNVDRIVWIDYNRNGAFEKDEIIASEFNSSLATLTATVKMPDINNAKLGNMRMRIVCGLTGFPLDPCGPIKVGEYEDYLLKLVKDDKTPLMTLLGNTPVYMEAGKKYTDDGATAYDNIEGDITSRIITNEQVDASQPGVYYVKYSVSDNSGNSAQLVRTVIVKADMTEPVITISTGNSIIHEVNTPFTAPTATVLDNPGNLSINYHILSNNVDITKLGVYTVVYEAVDPYGNKAVENLTVEVKDQTAPVFHLNSLNPLNVEIGSANFVDPTTVTDNYNHENDIIVTTGGNLDTKIPGEYTKTYTATDMSGNTSMLTRKFIVGDFIAPTIITQAGTETMVVEVNSIFNEPVVSATDNIGKPSLKRVDGGLNINKLGTYTVTYTATDGSGNVSTYNRVIKVVDTKKPVISDIIIKVNQWSTFDPTDFSQIMVQDNYYESKDFINQQNGCRIVLISNDVKTSDPGIYYACYKAIDGSENLSDMNCLVVKVTGSTSGINDANFANSISVYPNPSNGEFTVNFNSSVTNQVKINVVNMLGEIIATYTYQDIVGNKLAVNMMDNAAGVYMLNIEDNNSVATKKITLTK